MNMSCNYSIERVKSHLRIGSLPSPRPDAVNVASPVSRASEAAEMSVTQSA